MPRSTKLEQPGATAFQPSLPSSPLSPQGKLQPMPPTLNRKESTLSSQTQQDNNSILKEMVDNLSLLPYLDSHPHPALVLPSPRLSSSSSACLTPLWYNQAARLLMDGSFEQCIDQAEGEALKQIITTRDLEATDYITSEAALARDDASENTDSVLSFRDESQTYIEINLFLPSWIQGKTYNAILTSSSHPSFLVLHLHPQPVRAAQLRPTKKFASAGTHAKIPIRQPMINSSIAPSSTRREDITVRGTGTKKGPGWGLGGGIGGGSLSGSYSGGSVGGRSGLTGSDMGRTRSTLSSKLSSLGSYTRLRNGAPGAGTQAIEGDDADLHHGNGLGEPNRSRMMEKLDEKDEAGLNESIGPDDRDNDFFMEADTSDSDSIISCQELLDTIKWEDTRMGPKNKWPGSLRAALSIMLRTPNESIIWWGHPATGMTIFYNDAHARAVAAQHPDSFGALAAEAWAPIWEEYSAMAEDVVIRGQSLMRDDDLMFIGGLESYQSWRWTPLTRGDGSRGGLLINSLEATRKVIKERWLKSVRDIGRHTAAARSILEFSSGLLKCVEANPIDFGFAYLYHAKDIGSSTSENRDIVLHLAGTVGVPSGDCSDHHASAPLTIDLNIYEFNKSNPQEMPDPSGKSRSPWPLREAFMTQRVVHVESLDPELAEILEPRSWGESPTSAVVIPISDDYNGGRLAFLIIGLNTRRPYDADYQEFIEDLRAQLLSNLRGISLFESEVLRTKRLEDMDKAKTFFFTSISHELKTPLTLIAGPLENLCATESNPSRKKIFTLAMRNATRLGRLIDGLMDFAKLEAGRLTGHFRPANIGELTADLAASFRPAIEVEKIEYNVSCESSTEVPVYVDREWWEKIVFNLLSNAFKYTLSGSVDVKLTYEDDYVVFSVSDTGIGIPKDEQSRIFERFHRVASTSRSHEGTGIGLSLTLELINLHSATLSVTSSTAEESETGAHGSTFTVQIPYGRAHLPVAQVEDTRDLSTGITYGQGIIDEASRWYKNGSGSNTDSNNGSANLSDGGLSSDSSSPIDVNALYWNKHRDSILVVDDSHDMTTYLSSILSPYCKIIIASDGQEAFTKALRHKPDLIISDVSMPIMDGNQLLKALRANKETNLIPVILLTAKTSEEDRINGLIIGAEDYMSKPFSRNELIARSHLQMQLGKRRIQLEHQFLEQLRANELLTDLSPVGITRTDAQGVVFYANEAFYRQSGFPPDASLDEWLDYVADDYVEKAVHIHNNSLRGQTGSTEIKFKNGIWTFCQSVVISSDETFTCLSSFTDITDRKRLELERRLNMEAERSRAEDAEERRRIADEQKRHQEFLVSVISHELRNPLSAILQCASLCKGNLQFLRDEMQACIDTKVRYQPNEQLLNLMDEDLDALNSIHEMACSQERIANDVLSMGKIQLHTLEVAAVLVDLPAECRRIVNTFSNECRTKDIQLKLDLGNSLLALEPLKLMSDPVRLGQIVINLLSNAIRFTAHAPVREITISVDIRGAPPLDTSCRPPPVVENQEYAPGSKAFVYGAVSDTGPGLTPAELLKLFRRFSQASSTTHTVFGGSGLGLYVCRMLTDIMGGRIDVESVPGEGSTFRFFFEVTIAVDKKGNSPARAIPLQIDVALKRLHILVVEDNEVNQKVLRRQLNKAKITCEVANNGQEGVDMVFASMGNGKQTFDAVLMDVNMPILDGISAVKIIRSKESNGEIGSRQRIFGLTGNAHADQIQSALDAGMDDVVVKPYRIDELLQKLQTVF
ncbi:histidine kinase [Phaffia rhodozyma]|uniref:Histidine kinase n=1 Tax=Phaffia rhodozyma TaxID=264483 RepID=A0A0F7SXZ2_PHARH|nr:histidine kinase [Phaffia rhodozyma]